MPKEQEPQYLAGALWMIASGFLFVAVYVLVRFVGSDMSAAQTSFIRYCFGLLFVLPIFFRMKRRAFSGELLKLYFFRGIVHGLAVMLWFYAMARIPIAEVTAIGYTTPIYTALGAILIFKENGCK